MKYQKQIILIIVCALALTACAGKKKAAQDENLSADGVVKTSDVTTPPNSLENTVDAIEESNPDETVSFEEWKRKQADKNKPK